LLVKTPPFLQWCQNRCTRLRLKFSSDRRIFREVIPIGKTLSPTRRLTLRYIIALSTVALLALLGQVVIQWSLQQQSRDALVINVAGRQRMLSQRLSKAALTLEVFPDAQSRLQNATELRDVVALWQRSQEGLQHGDPALGLPGDNSATVEQLF